MPEKISMLRDCVKYRLYKSNAVLSDRKNVVFNFDTITSRTKLTLFVLDSFDNSRLFSLEVQGRRIISY